GPNDIITKVFGTDSLFDNQVTEILNIKSTTIPTSTTTAVSSNQNTALLLSCEAFIYETIVFLSVPLLMKESNNTTTRGSYNVFDWPTADFQSSITHLIELAEEKTGCSGLVVCIDKRNYKSSVNGLNTILRAFMYLGFELVHPSIYHHDPTNFVLVGYEL
ncbi:hypothetical protein BDF20DRAFT_820227, partial [Mycotypha africana]|uniref:uncharacterized protein n=1 Tax=Mycotypha africana TaxID=64632 RepID=UPI002301516F